MSLSLPHRPAPDPLTTSHGADPPKDNLGSGSRTNGTSSEDTSDQQSVGAETSFANYKSRIANQVGQQTVYGGQYIILHETSRRIETPPLPLSTVPFLRDDDFVQRLEFAELQDGLAKAGSRVALIGLGGIGKSQLAIEYCYRTRDDSPDTWVLWIHASSAPRFDEDVRKLADDVKVPGRNEKDADIFQLVYSWLLDGRRRWLIVLDNADDADFLFEAPSKSGGGTSLRPRIQYLPVCQHGSILVTTRRRAIAERLADGRNIISLRPNQNHAMKLLESKLTQEPTAKSARDLATALEYMPLAVAQAAAYINKRTPRCSIEDYLLKLEKSPTSQSSLLKKTYNELRRDELEAKNSILLTWQISFEHIHSMRPSAADLLCLMSFFDHQGIPEYLIQPGVINQPNDALSDIKGSESDGSSESSVEGGFEIDIDTLQDYLFISDTTKKKKTSTFEMHRLVQLAAQTWLKEKDQQHLWEAQSFQRLDTKFPSPNYEQWEECHTLYPHATRTLKSNIKEQEALLSLASILFKAAWFANERGLYVEVEAMAKRSVDIRKDVLGPEHPSTLMSMGTLASTYSNQERREEAEELQLKVMETTRTVLGLEHPNTLTSINNLALTYQNQGRWKEAEELQLKVMETTRTVLRPDHPNTLKDMANLALTYWNQGRWTEAEELGVKVIEMSRTVLGPEHPDTLRSIANLASTYWNQGRWEEAEELQEKVMETMRTVLGPKHSDTLTSMANLALTYQNQGRWKEAEDLQAKVMETTRVVLGPEPPSTLVNMANQASTYWNQGRWKEAEELELKVMESARVVLGPEHPWTLLSTSNLALTYWSRGRWKEAEDLQVEVMETMRTVLGPEHPDTLTSINNLALTHWNRGRWKEAEELGEKVVEIRKRVLGLEHPLTLTSIGNLALTYKDQGRWAKAEEREVYVMKARERVLKAKHPDLLIITANLANTYSRQGRWSEAEELGVLAMESRIESLGAEHPHTLISMANVAWMYNNQKRWKKAEELGVQVIEIRKRVLGLEHPYTLTSISNLASTYRNQGRLKQAEELEVQAKESRERILGSEHPDTLTSMTGLSLIYSNQGRWKEAEELEVKVIETSRTVLGPEHPDTLKSINNLAVTYSNQERWAEAEAIQTQAVNGFEKSYGLQHPLTLTMTSNLAHIQRMREQEQLKEATEEETLHSNQQIGIMQEQIFDQPPPYIEAAVTSDAAVVGSPHRNTEQRTLCSENQCETWGLQSKARAVLSRLWRPKLQPGYTRLEWICSCGELLYGDYREQTAGSLEKFKAKLNMRADHPLSRETSSRIVLHTYSGPSRMQAWHLPEHRQSIDLPQTPGIRSADLSARTSVLRGHFLQICVENGSFTPLTLGELEAEQTDNDGRLFERLRRKYQSMRHSSLPMWFRFRKPCKAVFVKFRLAKQPFVSPLEGALDTPCIPPETEVTSGNYQYMPCPIDLPPMDNRTFLHYFYAPAWKHPDTFWHQRLPWKLRPSLTPSVQGSRMAQGWGIHLEEQPDWPLFAAIMCILLLLSGLISGIYCWRTGDNQTGIAIGTWLTTVQATGATAIFFWWGF